MRCVFPTISHFTTFLSSISFLIFQHTKWPLLLHCSEPEKPHYLTPTWAVYHLQAKVILSSANMNLFDRRQDSCTFSALTLLEAPSKSNTLPSEPYRSQEELCELAKRHLAQVPKGLVEAARAEVHRQTQHDLRCEKTTEMANRQKTSSIRVVKASLTLRS